MRPRSIHARTTQAAPAGASLPGICRRQRVEPPPGPDGESSTSGVDPRLLPFVQRLAELIVADLLRTHGNRR
jgi:hypothetical protein